AERHGAAALREHAAASYVDIESHDLVVWADLAEEVDFAATQSTSGSLRATQCQVDAKELPHRLNSQAPWLDWIVTEVAPEVPCVERHIVLADDSSAWTVMPDLGYPVEHQERRSRQGRHLRPRSLDECPISMGHQVYPAEFGLAAILFVGHPCS